MKENNVVVLEEKETKPKKTVKSKKVEESKLSSKDVCDLLGISKRMQFVVNKKFNTNELKTQEEWKRLFSKERIIE